jgi:hypothetical protein
VNEWTVATLKEHYDSILTERALQYEQRFQANEQRLLGMNEFRQAVNDILAKCMTRTEAYAWITLGCLISGTIVGVVTFFMRK